MNEHEQFVVEDLMRLIGQAVDHTLKDNVGHKGWALLVFDFHESGIANYISNANRQDMIKLLRETADRIENNEEIPPVFPTIQ